MEDESLLAVLLILRREYDSAKVKHPAFPTSLTSALGIIMEELGELAKEVNEKNEGYKERAQLEASHVAVTAIRTMIALEEE